MRDAHLPDGWRVPGAVTLSLLLLVFILYQQTIFHLTGIWNQVEIGNYAHGYLVLAISAYLIFSGRKKLSVLAPCPAYSAIVVVVASSMLWVVAAAVNIAVLQAVGLLLLVLSILWAILGYRVIKILAFPILYIGFAIPIWFPLSPLLQELTAGVVFWVIRVMEIPALRVENMIVLPAGKLLIAEACSGLRYLLAALALGTLYGYLNFETLSARLITVLISAAAAILANIIRVFIVVYLGYTTQMQHSLVWDHLYLGWYLFAGLAALLMVADTLWQKKQTCRSNEEADTVALKSDLCHRSKVRYLMFATMTALIVSAGPLFLLWVNTQAKSDDYLLSMEFSTESDKWIVVEAIEDDWEPRYQGAVGYKRLFRDINSSEIFLYLGLYSQQKQGKELINSLNEISDGKIWQVRYQKAVLHNVDGRQVLEQLLENAEGQQRLVWYWYSVAGESTVSKYEAKILQIQGLLQGAQRAALIAVAANFDGEPDVARQQLGQFVEELGGSIDRIISGET